MPVVFDAAESPGLVDLRDAFQLSYHRGGRAALAVAVFGWLVADLMRAAARVPVAAVAEAAVLVGSFEDGIRGERRLVIGQSDEIADMLASLQDELGLFSIALIAKHKAPGQ